MVGIKMRTYAVYFFSKNMHFNGTYYSVLKLLIFLNLLVAFYAVPALWMFPFVS